MMVLNGLSLELGQKDANSHAFLNRGKLVHPSVPALTVKKVLVKRLFVYDKNTGREFLVDTGSAVSVLPILGRLKRKFQWPCILASVSKPILGAGFLEHYNLSVDMKLKKLLDGTSAIGLEKPISANEPIYVATVQGDSPYVKLLLKFSENQLFM
ncbi:hypothetical protein AVEN_178091-1 [Araneus ventricosus]|uniref:Peptidase A2 domain-containing protein n=1 Tax=Araneus ventricosus TaxID=182803 RepID=A0A4Y2JPA4_ARAVE|nr:hypothetical protein AVEN_178091-1 [Araneus ventricosus]